LDRILASLHNIASEFEVIFVNDGSSDSSLGVLKSLYDKYDCVSVINLTRNYGQHNAVLCGLRHARFAITITIDDDLQNPPEEIEKLIKTLEQGYDVVYGIPSRQQHGFFRRIASIVVKWALKTTMNIDFARYVQPFRAFKTELRKAFAAHTSPHVSIDVLLSWGTSRFGYCVVHHDVRATGRSAYGFIKLLNHAFNMIAGYSIAPLRVAIFFGFAFAAFGFLLLCVVLLSLFIQGDIPRGFPFLASVVLMFSGVQLLFLGIAGEYIGRMYCRIMDQPPYIEQENWSAKRWSAIDNGHQ
jgi:undecaprenyl-phosphate 4-deoxy-4-formamido-L-arabinose transferase